MFFGWRTKRSHALVIDDGPSLEVEHNETILNCALRNNIHFPFSCKVGGCGSCRCRLVSGNVRELTDKSYLLTKEEMEQRIILGCQSIPLSDVVVELPADARRRVRGKIVRQVQLTPDIIEVFFRLEAPVHYVPGQHASVQALGTDIPARCYSFAHAAAVEGQREVSFIVRAMPQGRMSRWLMDPASIDRDVRLIPGQGDFRLRHGTRDLLCVAGGSGLAPLIALLEGALGSAATQRNVVLLMGARRRQDLYYLPQIEAIREQWKGRFDFVPVLSEEPPDTGWIGMRGWVTEAITVANARDAEGYLCGPPPMIDAAIARMTAFGCTAQRIYFDKFTDQSIAATTGRSG